jgi:glycosyltransferase involved in cell wall biosynthesis
MKVLALEAKFQSNDYRWSRSSLSQDFQYILLESSEKNASGFSNVQFQSFFAACEVFKPDVVVLPGWSSKLSIAALLWCSINSIPTIIMSESSARDYSRFLWLEKIKSYIIRNVSAALVGGSLHKGYLQRLGIPADVIFQGYDAVDNSYFSSAKIIATKVQLSTGLENVIGSISSEKSYFLASARFISKKNLPFLLLSYARYRELTLSNLRDSNLNSNLYPWSLKILGDGYLRSELEKEIFRLDLTNHVQLLGFIQYPELPYYYVGAGAFIHSSTTEQWGLVVNEAMASGLPVLVSNRCGCVPELVKEGVNGWTFDPTNVEQLANLMLRISSMSSDEREQMGLASSNIIADWGPDRFAHGLSAAVECALRVGPKPATFLDRILLKILSFR